MPFIPPEQVAQAKQMDLLTYLRTFEPEELVHFSGEVYTTRSHDSLKISNGKWMWWSRKIGGRSALDYLIKVKGLSFMEAVVQITGTPAVPMPQPPKEVPRPQKLLLPEASPTNDIVTAYLVSRGIHREIIAECIRQGILFESLPYHNAVFVGFDSGGVPRYGAFRSTNGSRILGDAAGSDKHFSFRLVGGSGSLHVFESAIDAMSYATLLLLEHRDWKKENLLSLAGVYSPKNGKLPAALDCFLRQHPDIREIRLHLDNDRAGREATAALMQIIPQNVKVIDEPVPYGKDVNDFLCFRTRQKNQIRKDERT